MLNNFCAPITQLDLLAPVLNWHLENFHWDNAGLENPGISLVRYNVEVVLLVDHVYLLLIDLPRRTVAELLLVCAGVPDKVTVLAGLLVKFLS